MYCVVSDPVAYGADRKPDNSSAAGAFAIFHTVLLYVGGRKGIRPVKN